MSECYRSNISKIAVGCTIWAESGEISEYISLNLCVIIGFLCLAYLMTVTKFFTLVKCGKSLLTGEERSV